MLSKDFKWKEEDDEGAEKSSLAPNFQHEINLCTSLG